MEKTWRWFGPSDKITLGMLRQIGVEGIVTALHGLAPGELWTGVSALSAVFSRRVAGYWKYRASQAWSIATRPFAASRICGLRLRIPAQSS